MLNRDRVYMLAADHRWQWEEWCDARTIPRARIPEAKELARRGFELARRQSAAARDYGALLLDEQYASASVAKARDQGVAVGTPAEKAGAFPLEWAADPFTRSLTGRFVKVLVRHRDDQPAAIRERQLQKLLMLQQWCRETGKPLVVEVLVPRDGEPEAAFDAEGRPAMLASYIREGYRRGLTPDFWKIEGSGSREGAAIVDAAIGEHPACRQLILGKAASFDVIASWFAASRSSASASGFAIGRSVYWDPSADFIQGKLGEKEAVDRICGNYLALIDVWERPHST